MHWQSLIVALIVTACVAPEERYVATQFKVVGKGEKNRLANEAIYEHYQTWVRQHAGRVGPVGIKRLGILIRQRYGNMIEMGVGKVGSKSVRYYEGLAFINPLY